MLLFSCNEKTKTQKEKPNKKETIAKKENLKSITERKNNSKEDIQIQFSDLSISMKDFDTSWKDEHINDNIYETKNDTAVFYLDPGYLLERPFKIDQPEFDEIELFGQFETKVGIYSKQELEQPLCILEDWKNHLSEWTKLEVNRKDLQFPIINDKTNNPISFTIDELKIAVEKHCGSEWLNEVRNIKSLDKINTNFFTTRYIYKIKAKNSRTSKTVEKFFVFYTPTSC